MRQKRRPLSQFSDVVPPKAPTMRCHVHSLCGRNDNPCGSSAPSGISAKQKSVDVYFPRQKPYKLSKLSTSSKHVFLRHPQDFPTFFSTFHVEKSEPCKNHVFSRQRIRRPTWESWVSLRAKPDRTKRTLGLSLYREIYMSTTFPLKKSLIK